MGAVAPSAGAVNDVLSGQTPVSITPTTTPLPALAVPPSVDHTPLRPERPRKSTELRSSVVLCSRSGTTESTPPVISSFTACARVSSATKLFEATELLLSASAPTLRATLLCLSFRWLR